MRLARNLGNALTTEHQANAGKNRGRLAKKRVIETTPATEPETFVIKSKPRNKSAIEFRQGNAWTTQRVRLAQTERPRHDHLVPTRDLMPVELRRRPPLD